MPLCADCEKGATKLADRMTIDSGEVQAIAANIHALNEELSDLLNSTKARIHDLSNTYTGAAADATIAAFDRFAGSYFSTYYEMIEQYVKFLRSSVAEGYTQVVSANVKLADQLK